MPSMSAPRDTTPWSIEVCDVDEDGGESNCEIIYDCVED